MKLISDKTKITNFSENVLFNVETDNGYCGNFDEHRTKIIDRIESLIKDAIDDSDDVKLLVNTYLNMDVYGSPYTMANIIAESQQMAASLTPLKERYHLEQTVAQTKMNIQTPIADQNKFSEKEEKTNKQLYEAMTLIQYLETLQFVFNENC